MFKMRVITHLHDPFLDNIRALVAQFYGHILHELVLNGFFFFWNKKCKYVTKCIQLLFIYKKNL